MTAIDYIELPATDLAATKSFYTAVFAWEWVDYGPTYAATSTPNVEVALNCTGTVAPRHAVGAEDGLGPLVLFQTGDLAAIQHAVTKAGGEIISAPYSYPGGTRLHFVDPSGNILGVYQPTAD